MNYSWVAETPVFVFIKALRIWRYIGLAEQWLLDMDFDRDTFMWVCHIFNISLLDSLCFLPVKRHCYVFSTTVMKRVTFRGIYWAVRGIWGLGGGRLESN